MVVPSGKLVSKRFRVAAVAVVVVAVLVVAVILYDFSSGSSSSAISANGQLSNAGEVLVSEGSTYPAIVHVIRGSLNATDNSISASVVVGGVISSVAGQENVQWTLLLILQNQTATLETYTVNLELNSSGFFGEWNNVTTGEVVPCNVSYVGSSLFAQANVDLGGVTQIEWNVNSVYQSYSDGALVAYASDTAPDVGFATLNLPS
jgi:hypothetical protein